VAGEVVVQMHLRRERGLVFLILVDLVCSYNCFERWVGFGQARVIVAEMELMCMREEVRLYPVLESLDMGDTVGSHIGSVAGRRRRHHHHVRRKSLYLFHLTLLLKLWRIAAPAGFWPRGFARSTRAGLGGCGDFARDGDGMNRWWWL
jgi:hypothetical protein